MLPVSDDQIVSPVAPAGEPQPGADVRTPLTSQALGVHMVCTGTAETVCKKGAEEKISSRGCASVEKFISWH